MTVAGHRHQRIAGEIRQEIGAMLAGELKDPRLSVFATITEVRMTPDLKQAKVYVSVMAQRTNKRTPSRPSPPPLASSATSSANVSSSAAPPNSCSSSTAPKSTPSASTNSSAAPNPPVRDNEAVGGFCSAGLP